MCVETHWKTAAPRLTTTEPLSHIVANVGVAGEAMEFRLKLPSGLMTPFIPFRKKGVCCLKVPPFPFCLYDVSCFSRSDGVYGLRKP